LAEEDIFRILSICHPGIFLGKFINLFLENFLSFFILKISLYPKLTKLHVPSIEVFLSYVPTKLETSSLALAARQSKIIEEILKGKEKEIERRIGFSVKYVRIRHGIDFSKVLEEGINALPAIRVGSRVFSGEEALLLADAIANGVDPLRINSLGYLRLESLKAKAKRILEKASELGIDLNSVLPGAKDKLAEIAAKEEFLGYKGAVEAENLIKNAEEELSKASLGRLREEVYKKLEELKNIVKSIEERFGLKIRIGIEIPDYCDKECLELIEKEVERKREIALQVLGISQDIKEGARVLEEISQPFDMFIGHDLLSRVAEEMRSSGVDRGEVELNEKLYRIMRFIVDNFATLRDLKPVLEAKRLPSVRVPEGDPIDAADVVLKGISNEVRRIKQELEIEGEMRRLMPALERMVISELSTGEKRINEIRIPAPFREEVIRRLKERGVVEEVGGFIRLKKQ
jgi:ribosomal protein S25